MSNSLFTFRAATRTALILNKVTKKYFSSSVHVQTCLEPNFDDSVVAYRHRSRAELLRTLVILKICSYDYIVDHSLQLMNVCQMSFGKPIFDAIMKRTFYTQFVAGESTNEIMETMKKMATHGVQPIPTPMLEENEITSEEGNKRYDRNFKTIKNCFMIGMSMGLEDTKMIHFKLTGLILPTILIRLNGIYKNSNDRTELVDRISRSMLSGEKVILEDMTDKENEELNHAVGRLTAVGKLMEDLKVKVMLDAEYVNMNHGIEVLGLAMMVAFNKKSILLYNTYQCYLKGTYEKILEQMEIVEKLGSHFAIKAVRGAYMLTERKRAEVYGHEDPVCTSFLSTCNQYNRSIEMLLEKSQRHPQSVGIVIATHNEESIKKAIAKLNELDISDRKSIAFAQIYGIGDNISYSLSSMGFLVYKSIPYGPLVELLPYLSRRAIENKALTQGATKERALVRHELKRRTWLSF